MRKARSTIVLILVSLTTLVQAGGGPETIFKDGFEDPAPVITVRWDGEGDGTSWSDEVNWEGDELPVDGNAVVINDPGSITVIYDASLGTSHFHSLESTESLTLTGGSLEFNSFSWSTGTLSVGAGTLITIFGAFEHTNGTVDGAGTVTVEGLFSWLDGSQLGSGETVANGGMSMSGVATKRWVYEP